MLPRLQPYLITVGKAAHDGGEIVQKSVEKIREIAKVVEESAETIERLGESSQKIGDIVAVIGRNCRSNKPTCIKCSNRGCKGW